MIKITSMYNAMRLRNIMYMLEANYARVDVLLKRMKRNLDVNEKYKEEIKDINQDIAQLQQKMRDIYKDKYKEDDYE